MVASVGKSSTGINVACDLLEMQAAPGVFFVKGDFLDVAVQDQIKTHFSGKSVDVLLSDMAPNLTGNRVIDQRRCKEISDDGARFCF